MSSAPAVELSSADRLPWFRTGPFLMAMAALSFTVMVASVKVARADMTPFEIIAWRSIVSVPIAAAVNRGAGFHLNRPVMLAARALLGFSAMVCFFTAAKGLPLADLSLITRLQPVLVALLAPLLLGASERSGPALWLALALGLAGCAILIGPELSLGNGFGIWALAATVASAGAHTTVRALGKHDHPRSVVFWFQLSNLPLAVAAHAVFVGTIPSFPTPRLLGAVVICGLTATAGQLLMTQAYQQERAARVAAASYSGPLWAVLMDALVFGVAPGWTVVAGGALVILAGYILFRRP